jgi:DNA polymerase (family 10)
MNNQQLARVLQRFADLLVIKGENPFRINAYQRAAEVIDHLPEPVADLIANGELTGIPGIGPGIAAALEELVETGGFGALDELTSEVPATLLTLLDIPGLGPKTIGRLYRELGITNLSELEAAALAGRIRQLKGLGKRSEERILEGIAFLNQRTHRYSLGMALPTAEQLAAHLRTILNTRLEIAGSVRRMAATVGNVDLIAMADDPSQLPAALNQIDMVTSIDADDQPIVSALLKSGMHLRVVAASRERFGTAWVNWTGNRGHVDRLRELASGDLPARPDEDAVYQALGLQWIPPELREDRGEIEAAGHGALPDLITLADIKGDFHVHSEWSDGYATIKELALAARDRGYQYLGISDHSAGLQVARGLTIERLREQWRVIDQVNEEVPEVRLLRSSEVEVHADGSLDFPDEILAELDIVIASLHSGLRQPKEELTNRLLRVLWNPHVDIIAHPTGRIIDRRPGADYNWDEVFPVARRTGTALEIDGDPARLDLNDAHARMAADAGVLISIDSDAHVVSSLGAERYGIGIARRSWITPRSVINTLPLPELRTWLQRG